AAGQVREYVGVALPGDQRVQHVPAGLAENAGDHADSFTWASSSSFSARCISRVRSWVRVPVTGQVPELALGPGREERGPDHAALSELGQPHRVEFVFSELEMILRSSRPGRGQWSAMLWDIRVGGARAACRVSEGWDAELNGLAAAGAD